MVAAALMCLGLIADSAPVTTPELTAYEDARAHAKHDPAAQVRLALWCESHGLQAERLKHLAIAVLTDPANTVARGLMGLVAFHGQWSRPEEVSDKVRTDAALAAALAEYNARRERLRNTAGEHWKLALWCEQNGLKAEAQAHLTAVTRLDPGRESAWKRLGCRKVNGRWLSSEQIAAERANAEAQKKADRHWHTALERSKGLLKSRVSRAEGETILVGVSDPRAVPSVLRVFGVGGPGDQLRAVQVLSQIDAPPASKALAMLAIFGKSADVRRVAGEVLTRRDPREFVTLLITLIRKPLKYEVRPVGGPGSPGVLFVEGKKFNVQRLYEAPPVPNVALLPGDSLGVDQYGLPTINRIVGYAPTANPLNNGPDLSGLPELLARTPLGEQGRKAGEKAAANQKASIRAQERFLAPTTPNTTIQYERPIVEEIPIGQMMVEAQKSAAVAQQQLVGDIRAIDDYNAVSHESNTAILSVLGKVTGQDKGEDPEEWSKWWTNELGYAYSASTEIAPTFFETVPLAYQPQPLPVNFELSPTVIAVQVRHSCFGAGTMVRTLSGLRAIETLRFGDEVLTQDTKSGALSYHPILGVFHNPPNETLRINLGKESVVATLIHRFWKAGQGWVMARDLKPGDSIRVLNGTARVVAVESDRVQPVFNLEVGPDQSFFVGQSGALVHDNSVVQPIREPFDAAAGLAANEPVKTADPR